LKIPGPASHPDVLGKIFDPFFTTKPIGKGTGLGLSQVHGFAHQASGTIEVESELDKGTKVTVLLPSERVHPKAVVQGVTNAGGSGNGASGGRQSGSRLRQLQPA